MENDDDGIEYDKDGGAREFEKTLVSLSQNETLIFERNLLQCLQANLGFVSYMTSLYLLNSLIERTHVMSRTLVLDYNKEKARLIFRAEVRDQKDRDSINFDSDSDGEEWKKKPNI